MPQKAYCIFFFPTRHQEHPHHPPKTDVLPPCQAAKHQHGHQWHRFCPSKTPARHVLQWGYNLGSMPKYNPSCTGKNIQQPQLLLLLLLFHFITPSFVCFLNYLTSCTPHHPVSTTATAQPWPLCIFSFFVLKQKRSCSGVSGKIQHFTESSIKMVLGDCNRHHCCVDGVVVDAMLVTLSVAE